MTSSGQDGYNGTTVQPPTGSDGPTLPFTGADLSAFSAFGLMLMVAGLALRRLTLKAARA